MEKIMACLRTACIAAGSANRAIFAFYEFFTAFAFDFFVVEFGQMAEIKKKHFLRDFGPLLIVFAKIIDVSLVWIVPVDIAGGVCEVDIGANIT